MNMYWELDDGALMQFIDSIQRVAYDASGEKTLGHATSEAFLEGIKYGMALKEHLDNMRNADKKENENGSNVL